MTNQEFELKTQLEAAQWDAILEKADKLNEDLVAINIEFNVKMDKITQAIAELNFN